MIETLVIATSNQGKIKEFEYLARKYLPTVKIQSLIELGKNISAPEENGESFLENAQIKARSYAESLQLPCLADDSGLVVDALNGAPGIRSARFAGEGADDQANIEKVLNALREMGQEDSKASFFCALCVVLPGNQVEYVAEGELQGQITNQARGHNGFGYNPIFYVPRIKKTLAEIGMEEKLNLDHRCKAFQNLAEKLKVEN